jgi:hypothetical protein
MKIFDALSMNPHPPSPCPFVNNNQKQPMFSWKIQASHAHRYKYGMPKNAGGSSKRASLKGKWLVLALGISIF